MRPAISADSWHILGGGTVSQLAGSRRRVSLFALGAVLLTSMSAAGGSSSPLDTDGVTNMNVVVVMTDDQVFESATGPYSVMRRLNASPYGKWTNFTNAFVNASICCPSRAALLTGQDSFHTGVLSNTMGSRLDATNTLPVWLDEAGYRTALFGKYLNAWPFPGAQNPPPGWDEFLTGGNSDVNTGRAVSFINRTSDPYFLYVSYLAPHNSAKNKTAKRYVNANVPVQPDPPNLDEEDVADKPAWVRALPRLSTSDLAFIRDERLWSQRSLLAVDDGVQQIMDAIAAKGELERTLVVFMSDNGFSFGSHRWMRKFCAFEECGHVPLFVRHPGVDANRTDPSIVSNLDVPATIVEFTGVTPGRVPDGHSLVALLTDPAAAWRNEALLEKLNGGSTQDFWGIRVPDWKYVEYPNGDRELYDLANDPYELVNQAGAPEHQARQAELKERLDALKPR